MLELDQRRARHAWVSERRRALGGCPPDSGPAAVDLHVLDARLLAGEGQIDEAESKLRAALDARRELETGERDWRLPYELGVLAARRSRYELAESRFTEARTLLTPGTDGTSRARVALRLAEVTLAQGKRGVAVRHFHRAHTTLEGLEDRAARAHGVLQLGRIAESKGELGEAIRCGRQALDTLLELQDEAGISGACEQLGRACYRAGAYDEGGDWIRRALEARDKLGDRLGKARARHGLGLIAAAVGDPARADRLLSQAADGYRELGRHGPLARLLRRRGRLAEAGQDSDGARSHYEQALELDRTAGDWEGVGASAGRLADLLLELGEPAEALPRAVLAAEAAVRWPTRADPEAAFVRLDRVRQALGDDVLRAYLAEHPEEPSVRRRLQGWLER